MDSDYILKCLDTTDAALRALDAHATQLELAARAPCLPPALATALTARAGALRREADAYSPCGRPPG